MPPKVLAIFWSVFMNIALLCSLGQQAGKRAKLCNTLMPDGQRILEGCLESVSKVHDEYSARKQLVF